MRQASSGCKSSRAAVDDVNDRQTDRQTRLGERRPHGEGRGRRLAVSRSYGGGQVPDVTFTGCRIRVYQYLACLLLEASSGPWGLCPKRELGLFSAPPTSTHTVASLKQQPLICRKLPAQSLLCARLPSAATRLAACQSSPTAPFPSPQASELARRASPELRPVSPLTATPTPAAPPPPLPPPTLPPPPLDAGCCCHCRCRCATSRPDAAPSFSHGLLLRVGREQCRRLPVAQPRRLCLSQALHRRECPHMALLPSQRHAPAPQLTQPGDRKSDIAPCRSTSAAPTPSTTSPSSPPPRRASR